MAISFPSAALYVNIGTMHGLTTARAAERHTVGEAVGALFPGAFALVMATGMLSIAAHLQGVGWVSRPLVPVNILAYAVLVVLTVVRMVRYFPRVRDDLLDHARGAGFFTASAGTCVLGTQLLVVAASPVAALWLWWAGLGLWGLVTYAFFTAITVEDEKPPLEVGINGAWMIAVVATQAVSVLGTLVSFHFDAGREPVLFTALAFFLLGCVLYLLIVTLIVYRFTFFPLSMAALTPPYWINMGAVAITTLAGATLLQHTHAWTLLAELRSFILGFTLTFWAVATWWIPLLLILGAWRHLVMRYPIRYTPEYWGMVFPLGMYAVCTHQLGQVAGIDFLLAIPPWFTWAALAAWLATFAGMVRNVPVWRRV